jgi:hypothetical protein
MFREVRRYAAVGDGKRLQNVVFQTSTIGFGDQFCEVFCTVWVIQGGTSARRGGQAAAPNLSWWAPRLGLLSMLSLSKYAQQAGPHLLPILPGSRATGSRCSIAVKIGAPSGAGSRTCNSLAKCFPKQRLEAPIRGLSLEGRKASQLTLNPDGNTPPIPRSSHQAARWHP